MLHILNVTRVNCALRIASQFIVQALCGPRLNTLFFSPRTLGFKDGSMEDSNKPSNYVLKLVKCALCKPNETVRMLSSLPTGVQTSFIKVNSA